MPKHFDTDDDRLWRDQRDRIIGLGERSFRKSYYPELRRSLSRLERFRALLDVAGEMILLVALPDGEVVDANVAAADLLGVPVDQLIGRRIDSLGLGRAAAMLTSLIQSEGGYLTPIGQHEISIDTRDGPIPIDLGYRAATLDGRTYGILLGRDARQRVATEASLSLAARVFADSGEAIVVASPHARIMEVNHAFEVITGFSRQNVLGRPLLFLASLYRQPGLYRGILDALARQSYWQGEIWGHRKSREAYPAWLSLSVIRDEQNEVRHFVAMFSDISESKASEARIQYMAHHDFLTGLPNRFLLNDRLEQVLVSARRSRAKFGLLFIDLDRFKNVNDTLGHKVGDRLLCIVAQRLRALLRASDTVSRQGGDEFIVLLSELVAPAEAAHVADKILAALSEPYLIDGFELTVTPSIGIAIGPADGDDIDTLLKHADLAMYQVKQQGRNGYHFFRPEMTVRMAEMMELEKHLRSALKHAELELHYQPQMELGSGRVVGVEALVRWHHPERGMVPPQEFIPLAEETRLILGLGEWVLRAACRQLAEWRRSWPWLRMSVNLSAIQFQQADLASQVSSALAEQGLPADALELEVTESLLMDNADVVVQTLTTLQAMGVALAIDDFGTGYSSLVYLKRFPVSRLKIDRSFVRDLLEDSGDAAICSAIIGLAENLSLEVVAEGIESKEQLDWLRAAGCHVAQGYYVGRPVCSVDAEQWLTAWWDGVSAGSGVTGCGSRARRAPL